MCCIILKYFSTVPRSGMWVTPRSPRRDSTVSRPADDEALTVTQSVVVDVFKRSLCVSVSQGGTGNLSHVTPNTSLGFVQATPSRVLPSPTVNTREALGELSRRLTGNLKHLFSSLLPVFQHVLHRPLILFHFKLSQRITPHLVLYHPGVIMDMFQAPTLLQDSFNNTLVHAAASENEHTHAKHGEYAGNGPVHLCDVTQDGRCVSTSSHCINIKPKHPGYEPFL